MWPADPELEADENGQLTYQSMVNLGLWIRAAIDYREATKRCPNVVETPL